MHWHLVWSFERKEGSKRDLAIMPANKHYVQECSLQRLTAVIASEEFVCLDILLCYERHEELPHGERSISVADVSRNGYRRRYLCSQLP